jgi:hypothetical protein
MWSRDPVEPAPGDANASPPAVWGVGMSILDGAGVLGDSLEGSLTVFSF